MITPGLYLHVRLDRVVAERALARLLDVARREAWSEARTRRVARRLGGALVDGGKFRTFLSVDGGAT